MINHLYYCCFSYYFYLPKKYLNEKLFKLFELFAKYEVFLEVAIPSIINNIEINKNNYHEYKDNVLWNEERKKFEMRSILGRKKK